MRWSCLALIFLAMPLMGVDASQATGCSCGSSGDSVAVGGVATSDSYELNRATVGTTFEMATSATKTYRSNASSGDYLSQGTTSSSSYTVYHTLSQSVVSDPYASETTTTTNIMAKTPNVETAEPAPSDDAATDESSSEIE